MPVEQARPEFESLRSLETTVFGSGHRYSRPEIRAMCRQTHLERPNPSPCRRTSPPRSAGISFLSCRMTLTPIRFLRLTIRLALEFHSLFDARSRSRSAEQIRQRHQHARLPGPVLPHQQVEMRIERPELGLLETAKILERQCLDVKTVVIHRGRPKRKGARTESPDAAKYHRSGKGENSAQASP